LPSNVTKFSWHSIPMVFEQEVENAGRLQACIASGATLKQQKRKVVVKTICSKIQVNIIFISV